MSSHRRRPSLFSNESEKFIGEKKKYRFDFSDGDRFNLDDEDAVSNFSSPLYRIPPMLKFKDFMQAISGWVIAMSSNNSNQKWFSEEGCECEFLLVKGGGWQKGRFRFRLEFIPDNPDVFLKNPAPGEEKLQSPLDDLRSQLDTQ